MNSLDRLLMNAISVALFLLPLTLAPSAAWWERIILFLAGIGAMIIFKRSLQISASQKYIVRFLRPLLLNLSDEYQKKLLVPACSEKLDLYVDAAIPEKPQIGEEYHLELNATAGIWKEFNPMASFEVKKVMYSSPQSRWFAECSPILVKEPIASYDHLTEILKKYAEAGLIVPDPSWMKT